MDVHNHRFDMTDPFAQVKQRVAQAETLMQQMPPAQQRALVAALQQAPLMTPRGVDGPVTMSSVPVLERDGGRDAMPRYGMPLSVRRPRQQAAPMPLLWRWLVKAERLQRRWQRQWQRQSRSLRREMRLWLRAAQRQSHRHRRR